jgi:esterase/lipase superfamily enzyme
VKATETWHSSRLERPVTLARWGHFGAPVLIFATAGGDAEEIERFHLVGSLSELIEAGRIKVYSCDSIAGRALITQEGSPQHRGWLQHQFQEFIFHEVVPAIRRDCASEDVEIITAGASIGAFQALAAVCRYPGPFSRALCVSGTYDLSRFIKDGDPGPFFRNSSPLHYLPHLDEQELDAIRRRFVLFASGEGRAEDIDESWRAADVLGSVGIPNRVDNWGPEWDHDWPTWRVMLPKYLSEWT